MLTASEIELLQQSTTLQAVHNLFGNYAFEIWISSALKVGFSEERILNEATGILKRHEKELDTHDWTNDPQHIQTNGVY